MIVLYARLVLAAVFAAAAAGKLADRTGTRSALVSFGVPADLVVPAAVALPVAEIAVSVGLLVDATAPWAALAAAALLVAFIAAMARVLARGEAPDCRCFGNIGARPVGRATLARNAVLLVAAGFVAAAGRGGGASATDLLAGVDPLVAGIAVVVALHMGFSWQLFRQNGRLLERVSDLETQSAGRTGEEAGGSPALGSIAPDFALPDLDGEIVALDDLLAAGRGALLFFTDPGCGHCDPVFPVLAAREGGPPLVVISRGSALRNQAKAGAHGLGRILLQDEFEVADAYHVYGLPGAVLLDESGRIASPPAQGADAVTALVRRTSAPVLALRHVGAVG